jgi:DNA-binding response OmpR family regulator
MIEDDHLLVELLVEYLAFLDIQTNRSHSWTQVNMEDLKASDLILLDLSLPDFDILEFLTTEWITILIILCTGQDYNVADAAVDFLKSQGLTYAGKLIKPFALFHLKELLQRVTGNKLLNTPRVEESLVLKGPVLNKTELLNAIDKNYLAYIFNLKYTVKLAVYMELSALFV